MRLKIFFEVIQSLLGKQSLSSNGQVILLEKIAGNWERNTFWHRGGLSQFPQLNEVTHSTLYEGNAQ